MPASPLRIDRAADLDAAACLAVADGRGLVLGAGLLAELGAVRDRLLERLSTGDAVYGVTTGMGAASGIRLDTEAQALQQHTLMLARSVGSSPWLPPLEARAAIVVRLRTFLTGDAGVSPELCLALVALLDAGLQPAIPATRNGAAGEIIPLAHLGGALVGSGEFVVDGDAAPAADVGVSPVTLGPKEGVAFIEGVPVTTALALLRARDARRLVAQVSAAVAAELMLVGANRDPFRAAVARGDDVLAGVLAGIRSLSGSETAPTALQAPLSFRVVGQALAHLLRTASSLEETAERALGGVTDSPAFLDGAFVGTAGFDGFELAAGLDALRVAVVHVAELSTARLHRLLDDRVTRLPRQLSDRPGLHAGMVTTHKRAVGVLHGLLTASRPASLGGIETSLGQEDVQSFSLEAADAAATALDGARDILACELLAITQARRLAGDAGRPVASAPVDALLTAVDAALPAGTADRPFGRDIAALVRVLADGWALA